MGSLMGDGMSRKLSDSQRAARAWYAANGDLEHRHTCGVFLKEGVRKGESPTLFVYIDSSSMLQDFTTNRDIYLIRLAHNGFDVADIQFRLSKTRKKSSSARVAGAPRPQPSHEELPPLDPDRMAEIERQTGDLPESLRKAVSEAMTLSYRRQQSLGTRGDGTTP